MYGFKNGNTIYCVGTDYSVVVKKIEIGTSLTLTQGDRVSTDYTTGTSLTFAFTQSGDILFNNYQNSGLDNYKGLWNRITAMSIENGISTFTIDEAHPLPRVAYQTIYGGQEVTLEMPDAYWARTSLDFTEANTTKVTSNHGIVTGKDITVTPLEITTNNDYDYTVINGIIGKTQYARIRLFTIQQKRGWETNADGSVNLIVSGDASVSDNTLVFNEEV